MTKYNSILTLGIIVAITPFLGIPQEWKTVLFVSAGILIAFLIFLIKRDIDMHAGRDIGVRKQQTSDGIVTPVNTTLHEGSITEEE